MAEQMPQRDGPDQGFQQDMIRIFFGNDHPFGEFRNVIGDGIIQAQLTALLPDPPVSVWRGADHSVTATVTPDDSIYR